MARRTFSFVSSLIDGFIVLYSRQDDPIADFLYNEGFLYVLVGKAYAHANQTIYIDNDNLLASQEATEYLYQMGHSQDIITDYNSSGMVWYREKTA